MGDAIRAGSKEASFVLRLWLEPRKIAAPPEWRWHIQHVQSGEEAYFSHLNDVLRYVESKTGLSSPK